MDHHRGRRGPHLNVSSPAAVWQRLPALAAVALFVTGAVVVVYAGRGMWFFTDEWAFLLYRRDLGVATVMQPHNDHWLAWPALIYRGLFELGGLHSYWPYHLASAALHIAATAVGWRLLRRLGMPAVPAALAATALLVMGRAGEQLFNAFQLSWTAPTLLFAVALLRLERPGAEPSRQDLAAGPSRQDVAGAEPSPQDLAVAAACLLCAMPFGGVALALVAGTAGGLVLCGRWRQALVVAGPALAVWLTWRIAWGTSPAVAADALTQVPAYVGYGLAAATAAIGSLPVLLGAALASVLLGAVLLAFLRRRLPLTGVVAACALVAFYASAGVARVASGGVTQAGSSRYLWVGGLLVILAAATVARPVWASRHGAAVTAVVSVALLGCVAANLVTLGVQRREHLERKGESALRIVAADRLVAAGSPYTAIAQVDSVYAPEVVAGQLVELQGLGIPIRYAGPLQMEQRFVDEAALRLEVAVFGTVAPSSAPRAHLELVHADGRAELDGPCATFVQPASSFVDLETSAGLVTITGESPGFVHLRRTAGTLPDAPLIEMRIEEDQTRGFALGTGVVRENTGNVSLGFPQAMVVEICGGSLTDER